MKYPRQTLYRKPAKFYHSSHLTIIWYSHYGTEKKKKTKQYKSNYTNYIVILEQHEGVCCCLLLFVLRFKQQLATTTESSWRKQRRTSASLEPLQLPSECTITHTIYSRKGNQSSSYQHCGSMEILCKIFIIVL